MCAISVAFRLTRQDPNSRFTDSGKKSRSSSEPDGEEGLGMSDGFQQLERAVDLLYALYLVIHYDT